MRFASFVLVGLIASTTVLCACAKGAQLEPTFGSGDGGDGAGASGHGGDGSGAGGSDMGGNGGDGVGGDGVGGSGGTSIGGAGGSGAMGGAGGSGGMGAGGSGGVGGNPCSFASPNACATAEQLSAVSGDEGGTATASGTGSKWLKVHVEETDSSIFSSDLSYKVTLTSPAGMDYDLFVKQGPEDGNPDCGAAEKKGAPSGASESVSNDWNDDQGLGGEDDSVWLNVEVRHVSGNDCNATWSLTVQGNP